MISNRVSTGMRLEQEFNHLAEELVQILDLENFINSYFNELTDIKVTSGALLMLLIPILEARERKSLLGEEELSFLETDNRTTEASLRKLFDSLTTSPALVDALRSESPGAPLQERSSLSVIKAFCEHFCNIPPFCGERKE